MSYFFAFALPVPVVAQFKRFTSSPHIYRIKAAGCTHEPFERRQTGFRVNDKQVIGIVTALHGITDCTIINAESERDSSGPFNDLQIVKVDIDNDVVLLWSEEINSLPVDGLNVNVEEPLQENRYENLRIIGYPLNLVRQQPTEIVGVRDITELVNLIPEDLVLSLHRRKSPSLGIQILSIEAHLLPGHSGAPIIDKHNNVIGIGNGGLDLGRAEIGWAIPWHRIIWKPVSHLVSQDISQQDVDRLSKLKAIDPKLAFSFSSSEFTESEAKEISFRPIESVLKKWDVSEPEFFRRTGVTWIDFEKEYVFFGEEQISSVVEGLGEERFHLIYGSTGGWREIFLRYIGWHYAKMGYDVIFTDCVDWSHNSKLPADFGQLDNKRTLLIVDNIQTQGQLVEDLFYKVSDTTLNLKVLLGSQPSLADVVEQRPYYRNGLLELPSTQISGAIIAEDIVRKYAKIAHNRLVGPRILAYFTNEARRKPEYSSFYYDLGSDEINLWILAYLLESWDGNMVSGERQSISQYVDEEIFQPLENQIVGASNALVTIAYFSLYRIPVESEFLTQVVQIEPEVLHTLTQLGEIRENRGTYRLENLALASIFVRTSDEYPYLTRKIRRNLEISEDRDWLLNLALIKKYLLYEPDNYDIVLLNLASNSMTDKYRLSLVFDSFQLQNIILARLNNETRTERLGRTLAALSSDKLAELFPIILELDLQKIVELIEQEESIKSIAWVLYGLSQIDVTLAIKSLRLTDIALLQRKIEAEKHIGKIGSFIWAISTFDENTASDLIAQVNLQIIQTKIDHETNLSRIGWFLYGFSSANSTIGAELANSLNAENLRTKLNKELNINSIGEVVWGMSHASKELSAWLVQALDKSFVVKQIHSEKDLWNLGLFLRALATAHPEIALNIASKINTDSLRDRINAERNSNDIAMVLSGFYMADINRGKNFLETIQFEIREQSAHQLHLYHMFSTMNPAAMYEAGMRHEILKNRLKAIETLLSSSYFDKVRKEILSEESIVNLAEELFTIWIYDPTTAVRLMRSFEKETILEWLLAANDSNTIATLFIMACKADPSQTIDLITFLRQNKSLFLNPNDLLLGLKTIAEIDLRVAKEFLSLLTFDNEFYSNLGNTGLGTSTEIIELINLIDNETAQDLVIDLSWNDMKHSLLRGYSGDVEDWFAQVFSINSSKGEYFQIKLFEVYAEQENQLRAASDLIDRKYYSKSANKEYHLMTFLDNINIIDAVYQHDNLYDIGFLIRMIRFADRNVAREFLEKLDVEILKNKLKYSNEIAHLNWYISEIASTNQSVGEQLLMTISQKFEKSESIKAFSLIEATTSKGANELAQSLVEILGSELIEDKIKLATTLDEISNSLEIIAIADSKIAAKIAIKVHSQIIQLSKKEDDLWAIKRAMERLEPIDENLAVLISKNTSKDLISRTIADEELYLLDEPISIISELQPELAKTMRNEIVDKFYVYDEDDLLHISNVGELLANLRKSSIDVHRYYIAGIDISKLQKRFEEEDLENKYVVEITTSILEEIFIANPNKAHALATALPEHFQGKLGELEADYLGQN